MTTQTRTQLAVDDELRNILRDIVQENRSETGWAEIESDDMFQTEHYCGGYDATEQEFTFSYYDAEGAEWWFQISYKDVGRILEGELPWVSLAKADV